MSSVCLSADGFLHPCFARPEALVPRVAKLGVTGTSAVSEPRTAATATTNFAGFSNGATSGARGTDDRRRVHC